MSSYYATLVFITITTMIVSIIHFFENLTLSRREKHQFIFVSFLIILGVICEFFGICLNSSTLTNTRIVHALVKAIEFTIAPVIPASYIVIIGCNNIRKIVKNIIILLLILNTFLEFFNILIPFIFYIDKNNIYRHGVGYIIYILVYSIEIIIFIVELLKNTKKYQIRSIATLSAILVFLVTGLCIRIIDSSINSDWLVVAITYLLFVIYYSDLSLKTDSLTSLLNRKSYEYRLRKLDYTTAIILLDVNNFKQINDKMGHACGDSTLRIISTLILKCYGKYGYCYRIGGDEFAIILKNGILDKVSTEKNDLYYSRFIDNLNGGFDTILSTNCKEYPTLKYGVSKGYSIFYGGNNLNYEENTDYFSSIQNAINLADKKLYENKKNK